MTAMSARQARVLLAVLGALGASAPAHATNGAMGGTLSITQTGTTSGVPTDITITGDPVPTAPTGEGLVLDGDYAVAAGGTRTTAVLGAVTFDPAGTIVGGTLSFITAAAATQATDTGSTTDPTTTPGDDNGGDDLDDDDDLGADPDPDPDPDPTDPAPGSATVTDCTVTGGTYTLASGGGGQAQLQLDCAGASLPVTWRLFVTAAQGLAAAQQVRAVQLEALPGATEAEVVDLTLTLR